MTNILLKLQTHMRIVNAYENCKAHINVPHETMKRESKYLTNDKKSFISGTLLWLSFHIN